MCIEGDFTGVKVHVCIKHVVNESTYFMTITPETPYRPGIVLVLTSFS